MGKKIILYLCDEVHMGGGEHSLSLTLCNLYKRSDYTPVCICKSDGEFPTLLKKSNIAVKYVQFPKILNKSPIKMLGNLFNMVESILKIKGLVRLYKPVLLHSNTPRMHILTSLTGWLLKIPVVCHLRFIPVRNKIEPWFIRVFFKITKPNIIAISKTIVRAYNLKGYNRLRIINNGFIIPIITESDTEKIKKRWNMKDGSMILLNMGRLEPWKGQIYVLKAFKEFIKYYSNSYLLIVGENLFSPDNSYKKEIYQTVKNYKLSSNVILTGHVPDPHCYIAASDILIHSTVTPEPFGRVIVEAMALKKPVIASHIGGPTEIIVHKENGLLCDVKNTKELLSLIKLLTEDENLYRSLSDNGYNTVLKNYTLEKHIKHITNFYDSICEKY